MSNGAEADGSGLSRSVRSRSRCPWCVVLLLCLIAGCGTGPAVKHPEPVTIASLPAALPAGSDWVLHLRPRGWFDTPAGQALDETLLLAFGLSGFEARFGRPLAQVDELAVAAYQGDRVYLLRGADEGMRSRAESSVAPRAGGPAQALLIDRDTLLVRERGPAFSVAEAIRRGRHAPLLGQLVAATDPAPCVLYVAQPLPLPPNSGIGRLLQRQAGLSLTLSPQAAGSLRLDLLLTGHFPQGADRNARQFFASVAGDPLGESVGLPAALPGLAVTADATALRVALELDPGRLARVVALLLAEDGWGFIRDPATSGSREPR